MNKNLMIGVVVVLVLLAGGFFLYSKSQTTNNESNESMEEMTPSASSSPDAMMQTPDSSPSTESGSASNIKEFTVEGSNFKFSPSTITVNKGDTVKITFKNTGGNHDWVIDEFNAKTKVIGSGETDTIQFVADKTGSFEYYCSVGNHRAMGMKGTLVVQ